MVVFSPLSPELDSRGAALEAPALVLLQDGVLELVKGDGERVAFARVVGQELRHATIDGEAKESVYGEPWLLAKGDLVVSLGDGAQLSSEAGFCLEPAFSGVDGEDLGQLSEIGGEGRWPLVGPVVFYQEGFDLDLLESNERGDYLPLRPGHRARPSALAR